MRPNVRVKQSTKDATPKRKLTCSLLALEATRLQPIDDVVEMSRIVVGYGDSARRVCRNQ